MSVGIKNIQSPQRQMSLLALRKTGAGTPVLSGLCASFCTVTDNGVGDYTIVVNTPRPFAQSVISNALPHSSGIIRIDLANTSKLQVRLKCFAVDGTTPAELDFDLICVGSYASDLMG
jgi:hypothetical protein